MKVTVLTGGVGGAKLVRGLAQALPAGAVTAIVNTGDDFVHLGLAISPDVDTLLYTLAGKANVAQGWGREGETWGFMAALAELGGERWFNLGDQDLALHVLRTARLAAGEPLSAITAAFARAWAIDTAMLPMSDERVATVIDSDEGELAFQTYFVARRCEPVARRIRFEGAANARPGPGVLAAIGGADAVLIAPSNPFLSIDPILAVPGIREALAATAAPVVAVSPIIGGAAVKGPTAKLMRELHLPVSNEVVAGHYGALLDGLLIDAGDGCEVPRLAVARTATLMADDGDRVRVARAALALAEEIAAG